MLHLIPADDPKQALRIRRFLMAAGTYIVNAALVSILYSWLGFVESRVIVTGLLAILAVNGVFFGVIRSGLNRRLRDPSLTKPQIVAALVLLMYVAYYANEGRGALLMLALTALVFGLFRLNAREFLLIVLFNQLAYGGLIALLAHTEPGRLNLRLEILHWSVMSAMLPWFGLMGHYIKTTQNKLRQSKTELETALATIKHMVLCDELTGVRNRRFLLQALQNEKARCDRGADIFCVCMLDIDHFKAINDRFGHPGGDRVLATFAIYVRNALRNIDVLARYGGEEFVLLLAQTRLEGARVLAERLRRQIEELVYPDFPTEFRVTVSIGIAQYSPGEELSALLARADAALYRAKLAGRNRAECAQPASEPILRRLSSASVR
jgi:diguanylate cyclase